MPAECPNCRQPIPQLRLFMTSAWGRFNCSRCGALLGIDVTRRLLAMIPWIVILMLLLSVARISSLGWAVAVPVLLAVCLANFFLFDRAVVHERTGFRCRQCGYDLQGQSEARCPECGSAFDAAELAAYKAGGTPATPVASRSRRVLVAVVLGAITLLLVLGILYSKAARRRVPVPQPAVTPVSTQPAGQPPPADTASTGGTAAPHIPPSGPAEGPETP